LRRLGSGWAIFVEAQRHARARPIRTAHFPIPRPALVDAERKADSSRKEGAHFESSYFLTFLYLPPAEDAARAESWLYEGRDRNRRRPARDPAARLHRPHRPRAALVEGFMPECRWLDDAETLTYLHSAHLDEAPPRPRSRKRRCISMRCSPISR
jgi:type IV secretory pathway VirB4 component